MADYHISKELKIKKYYTQISEKRAQVDDLNKKLKGASHQEYIRMCNERNIILFDIHTLNEKIRYMSSGMHEHGSPEGMATGRVSMRGVID